MERANFRVNAGALLRRNYTPPVPFKKGRDLQAKVEDDVEKPRRKGINWGGVDVKIFY